MSSSATQLVLFRRGRQGQRPRKLPSAVEFRTHCMIADTIARYVEPGWRWSHLPFGEHRTKATAGRLKRMGVTRGWPDFIFVHEDGRVCWLELKRRSAELSDPQMTLAKFLTRAGHRFAVVRSFRDAVERLTDWGVIRPGINVQ